MKPFFHAAKFRIAPGRTVLRRVRWAMVLGLPALAGCLILWNSTENPEAWNLKPPRPAKRPPPIVSAGPREAGSLPFAAAAAHPPEHKPVAHPAFTRNRLVRADALKISLEGKSIAELRAGDRLMFNFFDDLVLEAEVNPRPGSQPETGHWDCYFTLSPPASGGGSFAVDPQSGRFTVGLADLYLPEGWFRYVLMPVPPHDLTSIQEIDEELRQSMMPPVSCGTR